MGRIGLRGGVLRLRLEILCWILGGSLACSLLVLALWAGWFFWQWRSLDLVVGQFQNQDGLYAGASGSNLDVQETRESKLVNDMQQILGRAKWREEEASRGKQEVMGLLSDLSHQLKTPLANIILDLDLLDTDTGMDLPQKREFLSHAKEQALTIQWLLQSLLKASRLENGMIQFQAECTGIKPTIAKAVGAVYAQARRRQMEIRMEDVADIPLYHNPKWTAEAMANVLENAVKYAPKGSQITISMEKMELYTRITIKDQGPGIPEADYNKIFQRFYRGKQAAAQEGTGLGLYLAQLILQSEQGYLTVDAKENRGSRFHFFLLNNHTV